MSGEPNAGLNPRTLRSRPEPKSRVKPSLIFIFGILGSFPISWKMLLKNSHEGGMNRERLWTLGNRLRASEEGVADWDRPVLGSKEGTYCMVHWVLHATNESSNFTSETRDVLYGD